MKRVLKCILAGALGISLLCAGGITAEAVTKSPATEEGVMAEIVISKEQVMSNLTRALEDGEVDGNGVRLREKPSTSSTVLELMYNGEAVIVNTSKTVNKNGIKWYFVKRVKTGTWGYADSDFIYY